MILAQLEKLEKDYATLRSEHARYHAEITRLKHTANPLPAPPRHVPLEHFASLAAPSSARATWSAPAATSAPLYSSQRFDSTYVQRGGLPLAPACSPLNHKGHDLSLPRPLIVPGARPTEKFIPPVPVEIELGFTHHTKQTTSRRTGSSRKEMGAVTSPALGDLSPASRTGSSSEAGPSGHNSSRSTAVQVSHGDSTSTARQRQSQLSSASISGRRVDAHTPSAQLAAPAAPIRFDYRPQPLWISTPLIPQNVPNSDLTTAYPAFTEAAEQQTEPSALLSAAAAVTPNVPDSVATIYANTPSASSSHGRGSIGSASQNGAAYDGSVDHDSQISALMLNTLNIPGDDFRVTTRSEIATEFSGHFGSRPSDSGRPDVATHEATVGSILVRPEPSPASSWGTVSSRSSRSTSQSSLALGLTGLPTEPDTVPAEAQQQTQTPTYAPLTDVPPNGRSGVEYNATPRGRRVSFQDDSLWMPRQFTERRSEPPALGLSLDLGGDNVGQVIDGHHDLEQLDRSLIQLTSGRLENDQRRTPSSSSHSSSVSHSSVPSQAGGQQVWLGPRTGLPLYVSPSLDVPEADSRLSRTPASSDMVFSSWHSGGNAEVLPGSPSEGTRHRDAVYTNSRPESGPSRRPSMSQRSTASRSSSNSNRSAHGSIAPRSSELSRSRRNSAVTTNQWGDMQGNTVYGAPFSVDSRLPALSQSGLLLSFGTPSTSSAVIGTEEASEIRAPRPISSRSSSLFGSLASL